MPNMVKRSVAVAAGLAMVLGLMTACAGYGRKRSDAETVTASPSQEAGATGGEPAARPAAPQEIGPLGIGESGELAGVTYTVLSVQAVSSMFGEGHQYVQVELDIQNQGQEMINVNSMLHFRLISPKSETLAPNVQAMGSVGSAVIDGVLPAASSRNGWVAFNAPVMEGEWTLKFDPQTDIGHITWTFEVPEISDGGE